MQQDVKKRWVEGSETPSHSMREDVSVSAKQNHTIFSCWGSSCAWRLGDQRRR